MVEMGSGNISGNISFPKRYETKDKQFSFVTLVNHLPEVWPEWSGTSVNCSLGGMVPLLQHSGKLQKKHSSYWLGLWSGEKLSDGQSQSSCDPLNGGPK